MDIKLPVVRVVIFDDLCELINRHLRPFLPDSIAAKFWDLPQFDLPASMIEEKKPVCDPGSLQTDDGEPAAPYLTNST